MVRINLICTIFIILVHFIEGIVTTPTDPLAFLSTLVERIQLIESDDANAIKEYYSRLPERIFHCQIDQLSSELAHLNTQKRLEYEQRLQDCRATFFLFDYFQAIHFPFFASSVKLDPGIFSHATEMIQSAPVKERALKIETSTAAAGGGGGGGAGSGYLSLFEDYILRLRPFKVPFEKRTKSPPLNAADAAGAATTASSNSLADVQNKEIWLENPIYEYFSQLTDEFISKIPEGENEFVLPSILHNHYPRRLFPSNPVLQQNHDFLRSNCLDFPCAIHLSSKRQIPILHQCPANSHTVIWTSDPHGSNKKLIINLIDPLPIAQKRTSGAGLPPIQIISNISIDSLSSESVNHFILIEAKEPTEEEKEERRFAATVTLSTETPEYLFVPRNYISSFEFASEGDSEDLTVFLQCLVDASNLQLFIHSLSSYASISKNHYHLVHELNSFLGGDILGSFYHPNPQQFTIFEKVPTDLTLQQYFSPLLLKTGAGGDANLPEAVPLDPKTNNNRKNRRKEVQGWQNLIQWKQQIYSLLLPRLASPPQIALVHRESVVLEFAESIFQPIETDQTKFGYKLWICALPSDQFVYYQNQSLVIRSTSTDSSTATGNHYSIHLRSSLRAEEAVKEKEKCEERVYYRGDTALVRKASPFQASSSTDLSHSLPEKEVAQYRLTVGNLSPSTYYQLKLAVLYGTSQGPYSDWTPRFKTKFIDSPSPPLSPAFHSDLKEEFEVYKLHHYLLPDTQPIIAKEHAPYTIENSKLFGWTKFRALGCNLYFRPPEEEGGKPILGYAVYYRVVGRDFPIGWTYKGVYQATDAGHGNRNLRVTVLNLIDSWTYEFKILAFNEVGDSEYSTRSNPLTLHATAETYNYFSFPHPLSSDQRWTDHFQLRLNPTSDAIIARQAKLDARESKEFEEPKRNANQLIPDHHDYDVQFHENIFLLLDVAAQTVQGRELWRSHWGSYHVLIHAKFYYFPHTFGRDTDIMDQIPIHVQANFSQRIVFLHRSSHYPICQLASTAQSLGSLAVVIVDVEGQCQGYTQHCLPGAEKKRKEGFAAMDMPSFWVDVKIPVFFMLKREFESLKEEIIAQEHNLQIHHLQKNSLNRLTVTDEL